ncbi:hypothetical protein AAC387_Pa08g0398 [Persea americana]
MVGQRGELAGDGAVVGVQLQQVGGEEKRRREYEKNRLAHRREKRGELTGGGGVERGARRMERWSSMMGRPSRFVRNKWEGERGEERREEEGVLGIFGEVGVLRKTCGCK